METKQSSPTNFRVLSSTRSALRNCYVLTLGAIALVGGQSVMGDILYWDGKNGNGTVAAGNGDWTTVTGNANERWSNNIISAPNTRSVWIDSSDADFYTSGTSLVTVTGAVQVNSITFTGTGYTVAGTAISLTGTGGNITTTSAGVINAPIDGSVGLTKLGAAGLTLGGVNTYTGTTSISNGTLTLTGAGSIANSSLITLGTGTDLNVSGVTASPWTVGAAQTLAGLGTVTGATTIGTSGIHAPGGLATVGTQTFTGGTLSYSSGSVFDWDIDVLTSSTDSHDTVANSGLGGTVAVFKIVLASGDSFTDAFWDTSKTWSDIFSTGTLASVFSSITGSSIAWDSGTQRGVVGTEGYFSMNSNTLSWTAIPEPTSALAGLLLGGGLLPKVF